MGSTCQAMNKNTEILKFGFIGAILGENWRAAHSSAILLEEKTEAFKH